MPALISTIANQQHPEFTEDEDNYRLWRAALMGRLDAGKAREQVHKETKIAKVSTKQDARRIEEVAALETNKLDNWLYRFEYESDWSYQQRLLLSHDFGDAGRIVSSYVGHIARAGHTVEFDFKDDTVNDKVKNNIDNQWSSMGVFENEVAAEVMGMGKAWILVKADQNGMPFAEIIPREDVIDWSFDESGELDFIKIFKLRAQVVGFDRVWVQQLKLISKEEVIIAERLEPNKSNIDRGWKIVDRLTNPIGRVPVIDIWMGNEARPIIEVVAKIQVNKLNADSELRQLCRNQCLSFLQLPNGGAEQIRALSANSFLEVSPDQAGVAKWVGYPGASLDPHFKYLEWLNSRIRESANLKEKNSPNISGLSKQWDFLETETTLSSTVDAVAPGMRQILELMGEWRDMDPEAVYEIEKVFDVSKLSEKLANILTAMSLDLGVTAEENLKIQVVDEMVKTDEDGRKQIMTELEEIKNEPGIDLTSNLLTGDEDGR